MCLQRCLSGADVVESCQVPKHDPLQRAHRGPALRLHDWWNIATCLALKKKQKNMQAPFRRGTRPRLTFWSSSWLGEGVRLGRIVSSHAVTWLWRTRQRTQGWCYKSAFVLSGAGSRTPFLGGRVMWCRYAADPPAPPSSWAMACMWHHWPADCLARLCLELSALAGSEREKGCNKLSCSDG